MKNTFTTEEQHEIAGQARTIHERLSGPSNDPGGEPPIDPDRILDVWSDQFPNEDAFQTRLKQSGMTRSTAREQIAATHWPSDEPLPDWIDAIEALVHYVETSRFEEQRTIPDEKAFAELLAVIAGYARKQLPSEIVPDDAVSPMVDGLVARLGSLCIRPLYVEFKSFVEYHDPELAQADPDAVTNPSTEYYDRFIDAMFRHGFKNLCMEYPVLARQLVQVVNNWVDAVIEVYQRLRADRTALRERFGIDGDVTKLEPLSDDAHAKGRVPVRVSFGSSDVIYKPREVDGGIAFHTILSRLDRYLSIPSFRMPRYLSRDGYGWMELIEYSDLSDEDAVTRYYERAGAVVCAAYALNLTDCQLENLIVDGERPMIIDGETIFHPYVDANAMSTPTEIFTFVHRSILLTLLLPWSVGDSYDAHEENPGVSKAGLGSKSGKIKVPNRSHPSVKAVNTDVMTVVEKQGEINLSINTPSVDGSDRPPRESVKALVRGFEKTHETIRALHDDGRFFTEIVTPELIDDIENRLVYRATARYGSILRSGTARDPLRDGARLSVEFEKLAVPFFDGRSEADRYWSLYEAERRALRRRDVPRFTSSPKERTLFHDGEPLEIKADTSGYERCRQRIDTMDTTDQDRQTWLIRYAFSPKVSDTEISPMADISEDRFQEEAIALFDDAIDAAIETADHDRWISISPTHSGINLIPMDPSLYRGRGGIALTAAALHKITGQNRYRQLVTRTLDPVLKSINNDGLTAGLGGMMGIGSVVYTLAVIAKLLDNKNYREAAMMAVREVTNARLADDEILDVMGGSAGTLLGLLAYYDRYGGTDVLDCAISCGDRLLEKQISVQGYNVWKTTDDKPPLTGFSHGASGIAYALARLAGTTGESQYAVAAREGLNFESTLYEPTQNNWAKSPQDEDYVDKWCHGRAGMALARIGISEQLDNKMLRADANAVLAETATIELSNSDHLCCGNFGRAEALLVGARRGSGNRADAIELARRCLIRRKQNGILSLPGHSNTFVNPTFFQGVSGAAYTLLRLQNPDVLPSVLLLE